MLCPNCGTKTTTAHKFCRNCGMNLEPVSKALAAHLSGGGAAATRAARDSERRTVRRMTNGLFAGVFIILFGLLLITFLSGRGFRFIGVVAALVGIFIALVSVLAPLRTMTGGGAEVPPDALDDAAPNTGRLLHEQTFEPAQTTIADHTTELLNVEVEKREPRD